MGSRFRHLAAMAVVVLGTCAGLVYAAQVGIEERAKPLGRPLAYSEKPLMEHRQARLEKEIVRSKESAEDAAARLARQVEVLSQRLDATLKAQDHLQTEFAAFQKNADARFEKHEQAMAPPPKLERPIVRALTPSWFTCTACPQVRQEGDAAEQAGTLPFALEWVVIDEAGLRGLGIPETARMPCFQWADAKGQPWYFFNTTQQPTMAALEAAWRKRR